MKLKQYLKDLKPLNLSQHTCTLVLVTSDGGDTIKAGKKKERLENIGRHVTWHLASCSIFTYFVINKIRFIATL